MNYEELIQWHGREFDYHAALVLMFRGTLLETTCGVPHAKRMLEHLRVMCRLRWDINRAAKGQAYDLRLEF